MTMSAGKCDMPRIIAPEGHGLVIHSISSDFFSLHSIELFMIPLLRTFHPILDNAVQTNESNCTISMKMICR